MHRKKPSLQNILTERTMGHNYSLDTGNQWCYVNENCSEHHRGVVVITTTQLHSTKPELKFCAGSYPVRGVSEISDGEDLW